MAPNYLLFLYKGNKLSSTQVFQVSGWPRETALTSDHPFFGVWKEREGPFAELPEWTQRAAMQVHAQIRKLHVSSVIPISFCVHWCTLPAFLNLFSSIHLNVYKFTNLVNFRISARSNFINLYFYNNVRKLTKFQRTSLVCESTR